MKKSLIELQQTNEWLEFISQLGLINIEVARKVFLTGDYSHLNSLGQKALYTAGRGKTLSLEGNLIGSKMTFDEAQLLAETRNAERNYPNRDEILAYVHFEKAIFFEKFEEPFTALSLLRSARRLVESKSLNSIIDYQIFARQSPSRSSVEQALNWIDLFSQNNMRIMQLIAIRRLARDYRIQKKYTAAVESLMNALDLGIEYDYPFMVEQIKNSHGYVMYSMGEFKEAREVFTSLVIGVASNYLKSTVLENLCLTYYQENEYHRSVEYLGQAIEHSQKYKILSRIPDECLFMGNLYHEQLQNPELAFHYFEIGSQAALVMAEYGFSLVGDRLKVVKRLENRPRIGYSLPKSLDSQLDPFAHTIGKTWKQINDLFQFYLIRSHLNQPDNKISELPAKLGLKPSTYYAIRRRLNQHGYSFEEELSELPVDQAKSELTVFRFYVSSLINLTWREANQRFEQEVVEYLFKQVGYQKTKLAEKLDVSYPTILQKTKSI